MRWNVVIKEASKRFFSAHPVEAIAAGIGLFVIALGLALGSQHGWVWFFGELLCVAGAALSSIAIAWTFGHRASANGTRQKLDVLARQLETSTSQIHRSVRQAQDDFKNSGFYFAQIDQSVDNLLGVISEIGGITGRQQAFEVGEILRARSVLADLGQILEAQPAAHNPQFDQLVNAMKENVEVLLDRLESPIGIDARVQAADRKFVTATEPCPHCKKDVSFQIGNQPGDSAKPVCEFCGQKFHAHRASTGALFVRLPGSARPTKTATFSCPVCAKRIPTKFNENQQQVEARYCFSCGSKVSVDPVSNECKLISRKDKLAGHFSDTGVFTCGHCGEPAELLTANSYGTFGVCKKDDALVVLAPSDERPAGHPDAA
jgi:hypothetical protein